LTYNIHGWKGIDGRVDVERLARIIAASRADIVGLNEVFHPLLSAGASRAALDALADALGMAYAFGVALTPQFAFAPLASYGNALLTRYPLLAHAGHHLTPVPNHEQRGLLEARVLLPDGRRTLSVYVTHLDHHSETVRATQWAAVAQWTVRDRSQPHVVMGDFNALAPVDYAARQMEMAALQNTDWSRHLVADGLHVVPRVLKTRYVDACAESNPGSALPTFPSTAPLIRIDYIFVSQALAPAVQWCQPWETSETGIASDHLPLAAEIDLGLLAA
jgi:endonuclease/exonuclease/phosphatase family metal-dependent hydrolase